MKRIILILGLIVASAAAAHAQYIQPSEISSRGSRIFVEYDKLTPEQAAQLFTDFGGSQMGEEYLTNRKGYKTGVALSVAGPSMCVLGYCTMTLGGLMSLDYEHGKVGEAVAYTGIAMTISGVAMTVAGIPTAIVYRKRIKKATDEYNSSMASKPVVAFTPASSGIGIAMKF